MVETKEKIDGPGKEGLGKREKLGSGFEDIEDDCSDGDGNLKENEQPRMVSMMEEDRPTTPVKKPYLSRDQFGKGMMTSNAIKSDLLMDEISAIHSGKKSQKKESSLIDNELDMMASERSRRKPSPTASETLDNELGDILPSAKKASQASLQSTPQLDNTLVEHGYRRTGKIKIDFV